MWKCHKCGKPVYFAERKQSLGYNWHPECLRCEECGKRLNPGQHAEHKGVPYCHVPCYGALFGPQLFGHGTRVESHKSFGQKKEFPKVDNGPTLPRSHIESKLKFYNQFFEGRSSEIRCREVNGRLVMEGSLRIHWGVQGVIHLKENDDQRTVVTVRKRNSGRASSSTDENDSDDDIKNISRVSSCTDIAVTAATSTITAPTSSITTLTESNVDTTKLISPSSDSPQLDFVDDSSSIVTDTTPTKSVTLPSKLTVKDMEWDELDELLQVERKFDESDKLYQTMPSPLPSHGQQNDQNSVVVADENDNTTKILNDDVVVQKTPNKSINNNDNSSINSTNTNSKDDSWILTNTNTLNRSMSGPDCLMGRHRRDDDSPIDIDRLSIASSATTVSLSSAAADNDDDDDDDAVVVIRRPIKTGSTAIRRRPGKRLSRSKVKRRCSINGHFYDRETSFFTPPHGSQMSVWVTSLVNSQEVINLILEKYKVESDSNHFALFVVRDNGEQKKLKDDEYPLLSRIMLGPHEDVAKLFLMDSTSTLEVSSEVAQFLNLSLAECRAILNQYYSQEEKEVAKIKEKFYETKRRMLLRLEELQAGL